ncbi:sugar O-acetyltransferase [Basilea psittacipulmonis]|uniref:Acetyltransferase n=1 Tax=Basilea psittacipulmonis DSM 24701 TaxID=1072685 RepID=A0A077DE48_9BURK|nr:sugar O-acetyltransferase [Basilea psittacipulmonis]AIL32949.1 acetyltransferase [Basilea psittacipulmonis DSM 24701]
MMHTYPLNQTILPDSDWFRDIHDIQAENQKRLMALNQTQPSPDAIRLQLQEITGSKIEESVNVLLPFYSDFGRHIRMGKNIFINTGAMFTDLGGITIEDNVLIGPRVNLITVNHPIDPKERRGIILSPIHIKKNAWIGANATILPGVTIGENAIVAAGSIVNKDVPDNTIVGGVPAKVLKNIESNR